MKKTILFCISILLFSSCEKPIEGCMNPLADNYNPQAERENHSCDYTQWSLLAQNKLDLCGIWFGYGYLCGWESIPKEVILIEDLGNSFIRATKLTGDNCVEAGEVTWEGNYNTNPFNISLFSAGGVITVTQYNTPLEMVLESPNYMTLNWSSAPLEFIRATTEEIEELDLNINLENV